MAYIAIPLSLALIVWLALAARTGDTGRRLDAVTGPDLATALGRSSHRDDRETVTGPELATALGRSSHRHGRPAVTGGNQLPDNRRTGYFAHDQQPSRRLRVGQQEQLRVGHLGREVRSHPLEIAA